MMRKYPVLRGLSALARLVGWVGLILAGILMLIGVAQFLSSVNSTSQYQSGMGYFGVYTSFAAFSLGLGLLIGSIYLIILGEIIEVFVDIEGNTSETVRLLRLVTGSAPEQRMVTGASPSAASEPPRVVERKPLPAGFQEAKRRVEAGDEVFHSTEGVGVVVRPGRDRYFVWVRFQDSQEEKEMERFGLYQK
jgi:hypothetical protein